MGRDDRPTPRGRAARPRHDHTREAAQMRRDLVREHTGAALRHVGNHSPDPSTLTANIEHFIGVAHVPIGLAGPHDTHGRNRP